MIHGKKQFFLKYFTRSCCFVLVVTKYAFFIFNNQSGTTDNQHEKKRITYSESIDFLTNDKI